MVKLIGFFRARDGMSRDDSRRYYEEHHAPLITSLFGEFLTDYRRSYVQPDSVFAPNDPPGPIALDFDVVVEMWFGTAESFQRSAGVAARPEVADLIAADEEKFLDRASMVSFVVDERMSDPALSTE